MVKKRALKIPSVLISLGRAIECKGVHVHYAWPKKDKMGLFANVNGNILYCLSIQNKNPRPTTTRLQTILFDRRYWTPTKARNWLIKHDKKHPRPEVTDDYLRYRQEPPEHFQSGTFRTKTLSEREHIKSVIARPLKTNPSIDDVLADRKNQVEQGIGLYQDWAEFDPKRGELWKPPRGFLWEVDRAQHIVYESDKWTGKNQQYIHSFDHPPIMWVNNKTTPSVLVLSGGKIEVRNEGIVG